MQQTISLKLLPADAYDEMTVKKKIADYTGNPRTSVNGYQLIKRSIDARGKSIYINLLLTAYINEPVKSPGINQFPFKDVSKKSRKVIIIGAGPTGLFAALKLLEAGIKPVIIERGKDVRSRRRDLAILNREGIINEESNYCFGEGGAGTYSDGKLYTRSSKRGDIERILQLFVHFGAPGNILYDAHPHIGTNKLPQIITAMREAIVSFGGEFYFEKKLTGIHIKGNEVASIQTSDGDTINGDAYILATGHSARDIFELLTAQNILVEAKPFALGVRIEHPQKLIDEIQYHSPDHDPLLPPASYSLVHQVKQKGVFSFCMCPGGIIAPASTGNQELVVNGWSPSRHNNPFANSGMIVQVEKQDALGFLNKQSAKATLTDDPLLFLKFQKLVEHEAYTAGGGKFVAPAQRMIDFLSRRNSGDIPANSYLPGLKSANLTDVLPPFIYDALAGGFKAFGKKLKGYLTNEAVVVATESRTSSPVRIPRTDNLCHPQLANLYPAGEGAGYAGGIVSAAMDGERVAIIIQKKLSAITSSPS